MERDLQQFLQHIKDNDKFGYSLLGIVTEEISPEYVRASLVIEDKHMNPWGITHGGVIFTLVDTAAGFGIAAGNDDTVTLSTYISYIAPSKEGKIYAEARRVSDTYRMSNYEVMVTHEDGTLLATAQTIMYKKKK